ncbi:RNA polymerase sigma factor CnrH [Planctomycetes bacterium K23_9]|uniref:RNA polymerase sigma factor CnrH n=2 Tax=Stieleria marina TaxID=1930275 RepID=A0A517P3D8_9BACT|nr:RNA polymerase sigma factor CnrH [Planctomycetes bacterium K23_9]
MEPETRESLIARLPDHTDRAAWYEFVELYEPLIYGIGRRHGMQPADAGDLVQDVLVAVANSIEKFEPDSQRGRFRSWLFRVARNQSLLRLRKLKHHVAGTGDSEVGRMLSNHANNDPAETEFDAAFRRRAFRWAARRVRENVNPKTWEAFSRTAIGGESTQQVAKELNIEVGAVYLSRSRVMAKLKRAVENVSEEISIAVADQSETHHA